jgi:hypothetical protein
MKSLNLILLIIFSFAVAAKAQSGFESTFNQQDPQAKIQLFPNPAAEFLHVKLEGVKVANLQIAVRNIIGNEIQTEIDFVGDDEFRLKVKDYNTGYYLLALYDETSNFKGTYKFLKR